MRKSACSICRARHKSCSLVSKPGSICDYCVQHEKLCEEVKQPQKSSKKRSKNPTNASPNPTQCNSSLDTTIAQMEDDLQFNPTLTKKTCGPCKKSHTKCDYMEGGGCQRCSEKNYSCDSNIISVPSNFQTIYSNTLRTRSNIFQSHTYNIPCISTDYMTPELKLLEMKSWSNGKFQNILDQTKSNFTFDEIITEHLLSKEGAPLLMDIINKSNSSFMKNTNKYKVESHFDKEECLRATLESEITYSQFNSFTSQLETNNSKVFAKEQTLKNYSTELNSIMRQDNFAFKIINDTTNNVEYYSFSNPEKFLYHLIELLLKEKEGNVNTEIIIDHSGDGRPIDGAEFHYIIRIVYKDANNQDYKQNITILVCNGKESDVCNIPANDIMWKFIQELIKITTVNINGVNYHIKHIFNPDLGLLYKLFDLSDKSKMEILDIHFLIHLYVFLYCIKNNDKIIARSVTNNEIPEYISKLKLKLFQPNSLPKSI